MDQFLGLVSWTSFLEIWFPPCLFFTLFSGWIPIWGMEARHVYLLALASKIHGGGAQGGAPPAIQEDAGGLT